MGAILDKLEEKHLDEFRGYVSSQSDLYFSRMCHFTENHDEPRAALSLGGLEESMVGAIAALTLPGMRLTYFGQYDGLRNRLGVHLRRWMPETPNATLHSGTRSLWRSWHTRCSTMVLGPSSTSRRVVLAGASQLGAGNMMERSGLWLST